MKYKFCATGVSCVLKVFSALPFRNMDNKISGLDTLGEAK